MMKANSYYKMTKPTKMQLANWPKGHPMRTMVKQMSMEAELVNMSNKKKGGVSVPDSD